MQSNNFQNVQQMTKTTGYLGNHPKSHWPCWNNQLWLRSRVNNRPFSEAGKNFKTVLPCLVKVWKTFFLYPACPSQIPCILSVVEAWAVPCPKASFAKKKTISKWSVFSAQSFLRYRLVLPIIPFNFPPFSKRSLSLYNFLPQPYTNYNQPLIDVPNPEDKLCWEKVVVF